LEHDFEKAVNMKLILRFFEELSGLKINFIRVRFSVLGKPKRKRSSINNYLVVNLVLCPSDIWVSQSIIDS
jgi:hypothetical protein